MPLLVLRISIERYLALRAKSHKIVDIVSGMRVQRLH